MKKKLQGIFFCLLLGGIATNAQPVLTAVGCNPVIGENYQWQSTKRLTTVPSFYGANNVWDFSNLVDSGSVRFMSFVSPKGVLFADSLPNANIVLINSGYTETGKYKSQYQFDQTDNNGWGTLAAFQLDTTDGGTNNGLLQNVETNSPRHPLTAFPMSFGTTYTFTHQNMFYTFPSTNNSPTTHHDTITGIGYGTLKLPYGTFDSVVCVLQDDGYSFHTNGIHFPLLYVALNKKDTRYLKSKDTKAPIITDTGLNPRVGENFIIQDTKYLSTIITDSLLKGENKVWDFSNMKDSGNANFVSIYSSKGLPGADSFPASNIAVGNNPFETISYLETTPTKLGWAGTYTYDSSIKKRHIERDNPSGTEMIYPLSYGQTYMVFGHSNYNSWLDSGKGRIDSIQYNTTVGELKYKLIRGIGYGTLKLPNATYINVVCAVAGDGYWFMTNGIHFPLMQLTNSYTTFYYNNRVYTKWQATYYKGTALPLQITSFAASWHNKTPYLQWEVVNTLNTKVFNIQRSTDGVTFSTVGQVVVNGGSSYHFEDSYTTIGTVYYRLQQLDNDGKTFYSNISLLTFSDKQFSISPNPAKDFATISFTKPVEKAVITVYDNTGKAVIAQPLRMASAYKLNTQSLKSGVYVVKITTDTGNYNEQLLINK